jgi:hypothetical protein
MAGRTRRFYPTSRVRTPIRITKDHHETLELAPRRSAPRPAKAGERPTAEGRRERAGAARGHRPLSLTLSPLRGARGSELRGARGPELRGTGRTDCAFTPDGSELLVIGEGLEELSVPDLGLRRELANIDTLYIFALAPAGKQLVISDLQLGVQL